jgi:hypothetical protein
MPKYPPRFTAGPGYSFKVTRLTPVKNTDELTGRMVTTSKRSSRPSGNGPM